MNNTLIRRFLLSNLESKVNIHCVGDAMIDQYYEVATSRISPEAPVSIIQSASEDRIERPGGAANVAYQLRHYQVESKLICFADLHASEVYRAHNLPYYHCCNYSVQTPRKKRFLDNGIQVKRWDVETPNYGLTDNDSLQAQRESLHSCKQLGNLPDVAILSDYGKGFFSYHGSDWVGRYRDTVTIVDPKTASWPWCTIFKPNAKEAEQLTGRKDWRMQCDLLRQNCKSVVITQGGDGVVGWDGGTNEYFEYRPDQRVQTRSVIGAGDCFVAHLALAVAHKFSVAEAAEIAFRAGAIYVQNALNRPVVPAELAEDKLVLPGDLYSRDFKLVMTNGCFDILHSGHVQLLQYAKTLGDKLCVAVNSDVSVKLLKGDKRPIIPLIERMKMLAGLGCVDFVISFDEETPYNLYSRLRPDVLVKGSDWDGNMIGANFAKEAATYPLVKGFSTTNIIERIKDAENCL